MVSGCARRERSVAGRNHFSLNGVRRFDFGAAQNNGEPRRQKSQQTAKSNYPAGTRHTRTPTHTHVSLLSSTAGRTKDQMVNGGTSGPGNRIIPGNSHTAVYTVDTMSNCIYPEICESKFSNRVNVKPPSTIRTH